MILLSIFGLILGAVVAWIVVANIHTYRVIREREQRMKEKT